MVEYTDSHGRGLSLGSESGAFVGMEVYKPRGSRYPIIKDLGLKSHNNHGL